MDLIRISNFVVQQNPNIGTEVCYSYLFIQKLCGQDLKDFGSIQVKLPYVDGRKKKKNLPLKLKLILVLTLFFKNILLGRFASFF